MNNNLCAHIIFAFMLVYTGKALSGEAIRLTERDSGRSVQMTVGDELEIVLPGNPTTGFTWETSSSDINLLRLNKADFLASDKAIGSGGFEIKRFQAITAGTSQLKLIFHRPFETNSPPNKTFDVTVIIKK